MFNNALITQDQLRTLIENDIKAKISDSSIKLDISSLTNILINQATHDFSLDNTIDAVTYVQNLVNNNNQINQILNTINLIKTNPSNSQDLTPQDLFVQPLYEYGVNISLDSLSKAIKSKIIYNFNKQFGTQHNPENFNLATVPAKDTFQCAYLLNKDNIYIRVDFNTYYGGAVTEINSLEMNVLVGSNTDIIYVSTGIMGDDVYSLGSLNIRKRCEVSVQEPSVYNDVFIPIVFLDNIPYYEFNDTNKVTLLQTTDESSIDFFINNILTDSYFYTDPETGLNIQLTANNKPDDYPTMFTTNIGIDTDGTISQLNPNIKTITDNSFIENKNSLNLCKNDLITVDSSGFIIYDYLTGNSNTLDSSGYSTTIDQYSTRMMGTLTDGDSSCKPLFTINGYDGTTSKLYGLNIPNNTLSQYNLLDLNSNPIINNEISYLSTSGPETPIFSSLLVPNTLTNTTGTSNYDKILKSSNPEANQLPDFLLSTSLNTFDPETNKIQFNLIAANNEDIAYYNSYNIDITDIIKTYFHLPTDLTNLTGYTAVELSYIDPVMLDADSNGYFKLGVLVHLNAVPEDISYLPLFTVQCFIPLDNDFNATNIYAINKVYHSNITPPDYKQSNFILSQVKLANTPYKILMATRYIPDISTDNWNYDNVSDFKDKTLYVDDLANMYMLITAKDFTTSTLSISYSAVLSNEMNNVLISKLVSSNNQEPSLEVFQTPSEDLTPPLSEGLF